VASHGAARIRAAGALVWRIRDRSVEVAVIHRPRYDDWSLPKGKLEHGETALTAAVREIEEEIGSEVVMSRRLATVSYKVGEQLKDVTYWLARHVTGAFSPNDEVDELVWLRPRDARERLAYEADRRIVEEAERVPLPDSVVVLVRHARAGKRAAWKGADLERPLDSKGRRQADALVPFLGAFGIEHLVSADPVRCISTLAPFADRSGLEIEVAPVFGDIGFAAEPVAAEDALLALARPGRVTAVASQGSALPGLLERVWPGHRLTVTKKGTAWVLTFVDGVVVAADHYSDASR
jgi:8-oxo-dGTP pyrophosphatase MutT (NUDIX family)/phosphohistidine phosphatase SixA